MHETQEKQIGEIEIAIDHLHNNIGGLEAIVDSLSTMTFEAVLTDANDKPGECKEKEALEKPTSPSRLLNKLQTANAKLINVIKNITTLKERSQV